MDIELAKIAVLLKALDVPLKVDDKANRIAMQKAIYLAQVKARDLGYRFSWYVNGPYSSDLADAYYAAAARKEEYDRYNADPDTIEALRPVRGVIDAKPVGATQSNWLEAVGSLDFMVRVMRKPRGDALADCKKQKPHLTDLFDPADHALRSNGFA